jgi:hypothetical protein
MEIEEYIHYRHYTSMLACSFQKYTSGLGIRYASVIELRQPE